MAETLTGPDKQESKSSIDYTALRDAAVDEGRVVNVEDAHAEAIGRDEGEMAMKAAMEKSKSTTDSMKGMNEAFRRQASEAELAGMDAAREQKRAEAAAGIERVYEKGTLGGEVQDARAEYAAASETADKGGADALKDHEEDKIDAREGRQREHNVDDAHDAANARNEWESKSREHDDAAWEAMGHDSAKVDSEMKRADEAKVQGYRAETAALAAAKRGEAPDLETERTVIQQMEYSQKKADQQSAPQPQAQPKPKWRQRIGRLLGRGRG